jgi:hypothetical protein
MKTFKLTEEQFVLLIANTNVLRNEFIRQMNLTKFQEVKEYYQKEIDKINSLFDDLNSTLKTNF